MKLYTILNTLLILLVLIATGCGKSSKTAQEPAADTINLIQVTLEQFEGDSMKFGSITPQNFDREVSCNGYITAPPNGEAWISSPLAGIVESIKCMMGSYVRKGQTLGYITSNELMALQQEFTETSAKQKRLNADYKRSKSLFDENIGAEKDFLAVESEYKSMQSKYQSLKLRLQLLKLDVVKIEAGELYSAFPLISPIDGYITNQNMVLGQFVEQQKKLVEIIDVNQLQLQLSVFETDIAKIKTGQNIRFRVSGDNTVFHTAKLSAVSKTVNPDTKTILCLAKINTKEGSNLVNNSYVQAKIIVDQKEAKALPSDAILKSGKDYYIFVFDKSDQQGYYLRKEKVETGMVSNGFTEITGNVTFPKILVKGIYNLPL